ncbi:ribonuclease H-like domain-containing protein [Tanacetum coccineum]
MRTLFRRRPTKAVRVRHVILEPCRCSPELNIGSLYLLLILVGSRPNFEGTAQAQKPDPDPITLISKLGISDPLHLHLNDSTALTVVSIKLKGIENDQVWSCAMLLALEDKNNTGFIDGSCKRSNTDDVLVRQWD